MDHNEVLINAYRMVKIQLPVATSPTEVPSERVAVLINVGPSDIIYTPTFKIISQPVLKYTTMSMRVVKSETELKVYNGLRTLSKLMKFLHPVLKKESLSKTAFLVGLPKFAQGLDAGRPIEVLRIVRWRGVLGRQPDSRL